MVHFLNGLLHFHQSISQLLHSQTQALIPPLHHALISYPMPTFFHSFIPPFLHSSIPPSHTFIFSHSPIPLFPYLFSLLELEVESPQTESGLQLWDGGQSVEELLGRAERHVWLRGSGLRDLGPLIVRRHQLCQQFLHHLPCEVGVVHAEYGGLDVPGCGEPLYLDENVVGSPLVQNNHRLALLHVRLNM